MGTVKDLLARAQQWLNAHWEDPARFVGRFDARLEQRADAECAALIGTRLGRWLPTALALVALVFSFARVDMKFVYTESTLFLALAAAIGSLGTAAGIFFVACHTLLDVARSLDSSTFGRLVSDALLWVLVVEVPLAGREAGELFARRYAARRKRWLELGSGGLVVAALTALWCEASVVLICPVFAWIKKPTTYEAAAGLPQQCAIVAGTALVAFIALYFVGPRKRVEAFAATSTAASWAPRSAWGHAALRYGLMLALLSGILRNLLDVAIVAGALFAAARLGGGLDGLKAKLGRLPYALRFLVGYALSFVVSWGIITLWYPRGFFYEAMAQARVSPDPIIRAVAAWLNPYLPVVLSVAIGLVFFEVLLTEARAAATAATRGLPGALAIAFAVALWPMAARADTCNPQTMQDCNDSALGAAAAAAAAAALAGGVRASVRRRRPPQ